MKKPIFPRIVGLFLLYIAVLTGLVLLQFTKRTSFTHRNGNLVVSGHYRDADGQKPASGNDFLVSGDASIFFNGMEFVLSLERGFAIKDNAGKAREISLDRMIISDASITIVLSDASKLDFSTYFSGGNQELRISCTLEKNAQSIELPFRPMRVLKQDENDTRALTVVSDGLKYGFNKSLINTEKRIITFNRHNPSAQYAVIPDKKSFIAADYILPQGQLKRSYDDVVQKWKDQSYLLWSRSLSSSPQEDLVMAYLAESVKRGNFKAAVSAIPEPFLDSPQRSFQSSVYLGRLDQALRSLSSYEREYLSRISRLINEKSEDFFREPHVFYNLYVRNMATFINDGAELVKSIDPASLGLGPVPGIFEGWKDWKTIKTGVENPFDRLLDQAFFVVSKNITRVDGKDIVLIQQNGEADILYNLRLGNSLAEYGEAAGNQEKAAIGRSIVLSVLGLIDQSGTAPLRLKIAEDGSIQNSAENRAGSARFYSFFHPGSEYYPQAVPAGSGPGTWAWTCASSLSAVQEDNVLDISVGFPSGETHYMIIRGIKPFSKIQLYNIDFRTDVQFERYDSSGWSYSRSEQTLILKMKHRSNVEHIRIFY